MALRINSRLKHASIGAMFFSVTGMVVAGSVEPPPFDLMNRHGVNVMSATAQPQLNDISIGGAMGLSHWISTFGSDFVNAYYTRAYGPYGPHDKFFGRATKSVFYKQTANSSTWDMVMRVSSFEGTHDFTINSGCTMDGNHRAVTLNTFTSHDGDPRHLLEYTFNSAGLTNGLVWTKPDGTRIVFDGSLGTGAGVCFTPEYTGEFPVYGITRIEYPNGFTIFGDGGDAVSEVRTNTGFQLRYIYVMNNQPVDNDLPANQTPAFTPAPQISFYTSAPAYIVAINNAIDYCGPAPADYGLTVATACPGLTQTWPVVTYIWPNGMPRAAYLPDRTATFKVIDPTGAVTEYVHKPFPTTIPESPPMRYEPRLYQIKNSRSDVPNVTFDYWTKTDATMAGDGYGLMYPIYTAGAEAVLRTSKSSTGETIGYGVAARAAQYGPIFMNTSNATIDPITVYFNLAYGPYRIETWDKTYYFDQGLDTPKSNKLAWIQRQDGVKVEYGYDNRFNITQVKENGVITKKAHYPDTCTSTTLKICNQATWIQDGNGNQTDYEYDSASGQVKRIVMPANKNGVRAEIRYEYQRKFAYYKRSVAGSVERADTPVYLMTKETKCITSAMDAAGNCVNGASDTVTTEYDYGPDRVANNLFLRGVTVTAYSNGASQIRRTCYGYDALGNRTSETKPQAKSTSCY